MTKGNTRNHTVNTPAMGVVGEYTVYTNKEHKYQAECERCWTCSPVTTMWGADIWRLRHRCRKAKANE